MNEMVPRSTLVSYGTRGVYSAGGGIIVLVASGIVSSIPLIGGLAGGLLSLGGIGLIGYGGYNLYKFFKGLRARR